ncbi:MAG: hypothetical protein HZA88_06760 [Verrucomicrobia bacterium]|nr:hypothetical protein [Verrucomicrobiota bacterium]
MSTLALESYASTAGLRRTANTFMAGVKQHEAFINNLNWELQMVLRPYLKERVDSAGRWSHPNLLVPFLLNEVFGISDVAKLSALCAAYLACDHFTHLLDDVADERNREDLAMLAHASHVMLSRGRMLYLSITSDAVFFLELFEGYVEKAMQGERWLWKRAGNVAPYNRVDLEMLRVRASMLDACVVAYCDVSDRWNLLDRLQRGLAEVVVGVQLLDDVVDVQKDFNNGIYTMPLAAALTGVKAAAVSWDIAATGLLSGTAWTDSISLAQSYLDRGCAALEESGLRSLSDAVRGIAGSASLLTRAIRRGRTKAHLNPGMAVAEILRLPIVRAMSH